jgi:predicted pyridoxine 5'-phosphate oxidase superfamily flavin-nucleotide-binding protein
MSVIATVEQLEAIYGQPNEASTVKVSDKITPPYRALIDNSPFAALATCGPEAGPDSRRHERQPCRRRGLRQGLAGTRAAIAVVTGRLAAIRIGRRLTDCTASASLSRFRLRRVFYKSCRWQR